MWVVGRACDLLGVAFPGSVDWGQPSFGGWLVVVSPTSVGCDGPASSIDREAALTKGRRITSRSEGVNGRSMTFEFAILSTLLNAAST